MYKGAVVVDLDGTLLNDDKKIGKKDIELLHLCEKKNICRIIATGRSLYSVSEVLKPDFPADYLIFAAGAGIQNFKTKEILKSHFIKSKNVKQTAEKLCNLRLDFQIRLKIPSSHKYFYKRFLKYNPDFDYLNSVYKDSAKPLISIENLPDATRFIVISPDKSLINTIEKNFSNFEIIRASSPVDNKSVWMEIYPKRVNKGNALNFLLNLLKTDKNKTIGLGNDYNDIHFLDIVKTAYVVNNAPDILKEKYNVTVSNNENPLFEIFKNKYCKF